MLYHEENTYEQRKKEETIHMLLLWKRDSAGRRMLGAAHVAGWKNPPLPPGLLHPLGSGRKETTWET